MPVTLSSAPPAVSAALDRLKDELSRAAGENLVALLVYGGLARGRYRPGKSDVNVAIVLRDAGAGALKALAPALRTARRSVDVEPLILTVAEVPSAALVFPTKLLDIKDHHIVLYGENPFAALDVPRAQVSWRIVQELRNLTLRLRHRFVAAVDDAEAQTAALAGIARPLAIQVAALLRLAGKPVPADDRSTAIFQAAADAFAADGPTLAQLAGLRLGEPAPADVPGFFDRVLTTLGTLTAEAERHQEAPP
jgi:predicted nucleotidyltransferase